jgi:hypothetical protein
MTTPTIDIAADLEGIHAWWANRDQHDNLIATDLFPIAGSPHDQLVPDGVSNPYWELIRHMPSEDSTWFGDGVTPYGYTHGLDEMRRDNFVCRYSWAIPSPGDMRWLAHRLEGRALVEAGAGTGYWAWQAAQVGIDVVAYEPTPLADNKYTGDVEYFPLTRACGITAAAEHPDRALMLCWPGYGAPWAVEALSVFRGDTVVYVGETEGGCCADDDFFAELDRGWEALGSSPYHRTWWGIHCRMTVFRRAS